MSKLPEMVQVEQICQISMREYIETENPETGDMQIILLCSPRLNNIWSVLDWKEFREALNWCFEERALSPGQDVFP